MKRFSSPPPLSRCWTNETLTATPHRVMVSKSSSGMARSSIIRFNGLDNEAHVKPHRAFGEPRGKYAQGIKQGLHLEQAAKKAQINTNALLKKKKIPRSKYEGTTTLKTF